VASPTVDSDPAVPPDGPNVPAGTIRRLRAERAVHATAVIERGAGFHADLYAW